jgi:hypothetical protein
MLKAATMHRLRLVLVGIAMLSGGCSDSGICEDYDSPKHVAPTECESPDLANPNVLASCLKGSGHLGQWAVDSDGLPAFDFGVEHRCDAAARVETSAGRRQVDPVHVVGNGRGLTAIAHASGAVEVYSQDRGHKFINHVDTWRDSKNKKFPVQLGGGFNYIVVDGEVRSLRFDDMSVEKALGRQTRRFGVGYYETVTTFADLKITRRVFAPESNARALVAEVTLENLTNSYISVGLVEFWDVNEYQLPGEAITSDLEDEDTSENVRRSRREIGASFAQTISYSRQLRLAVTESVAKSLPAEVVDRRSPSMVDYFPGDVFLAPLDTGSVPDAVWLSDDELWDASSTKRPPPDRAAESSDAETRMIEIDGEQQAGVMAMRVDVSVPNGAPLTRRFAFGYTTGDTEAEVIVSGLRAQVGELSQAASDGWKERLAWVAVDAEDSGVVQREVAWSSYYAQAQATFSEALGARELGGGGAAQFVAGRNAAAGTQAMFSEGLTHIDPGLARENLIAAMASQHGATSDTPWRFPLGSTGVDSFSDGDNHGQRSDSYFLLPSAVARYVADTRDFELLTAKAPFWPASEGETGSVIDHLSRTLQYATEELGTGAKGFTAIGTGDFSDDLLEQATEAATPAGASSVFNAAVGLHGFPLVADLVGIEQPDLADGYQTFLDAQADALENQAWNGMFYERAFADSGNPLADQVVFLSAQVLPILAGLVDVDRRDALLDLIAAELETPAGALNQGAAGSARVTPAVNAWLTEAYSLRDPAEAWQSLIRSTMAAHADAFPKVGYGVWTGPDSFAGPDADYPGQARLASDLSESDYPALSSQLHLAPVRATLALAGIHTSLGGWRIEPRFPSENFSMILPRMELFGTPNSLEGVIVSSGDEILNLIVKLPSGAQSSGLAVKVKDTAVEFTRGDDNTVEFSVPLTRDERVSWSVRGL